jgi:hypothetical protein
MGPAEVERQPAGVVDFGLEGGRAGLPVVPVLLDLAAGDIVGGDDAGDIEGTVRPPDEVVGCEGSRGSLGR